MTVSLQAWKLLRLQVFITWLNCKLYSVCNFDVLSALFIHLSMLCWFWIYHCKRTFERFRSSETLISVTSFMLLQLNNTFYKISSFNCGICVLQSESPCFSPSCLFLFCARWCQRSSPSLSRVSGFRTRTMEPCPCLKSQSPLICPVL